MIYACGQKSEKILQPEEFKAIVKDMHIADGVAVASNHTTKLKSDTSKNIYSYILKKHGASRTQFENSIEYYAENTTKYTEIYEEIIAELQAEEDSIRIPYKKRKEVKKDSTNLWNKKQRWHLPQEGKTNPISYKLKTSEHGIYTLSANIKLYTDDGSVSQRMTIMVKYEDGTKEENSVGNIKKNAIFTKHEVFIRTDPQKELKEISGWVLNHSKGTTNKHAVVKDISLKMKKFNQP